MGKNENLLSFGVFHGQYNEENKYDHIIAVSRAYLQTLPLSHKVKKENIPLQPPLSTTLF